MDAAATLLLNSISPDGSARTLAENTLRQIAQADLASYVHQLAAVMANDNVQAEIRFAAGLAIKNVLTTKEEAHRTSLMQAWLSINPQVRQYVRMAAFHAFNAESEQVGSGAAQVISMIASAELPVNIWPDAVDNLLNFTQTGDDKAKRSSLEAIGYLTEELGQYNKLVLEQQIDKILSAVISGVSVGDESIKIREKAINALCNSLEYISANMNDTNERNKIMEVVCHAASSSSSIVKERAFECLVKLVTYYYQHMLVYVSQAIYGLTLEGMTKGDDQIQMQAIEFWSSVCDVEAEIKEELQIAPESPRPFHDFSGQAFATIVPILLHLLTRTEEGDEEDDWNVPLAAGTCLSLFASTVGPQVTETVMPFVSLNMGSQDWKFRDAAVMAFGSVLEARNEYPAGYIEQIQTCVGSVLALMKDPKPKVRDTAAWAVGRACELLREQIPPAHLQAIVKNFLVGLEDSDSIAVTCAWALAQLGENYEGLYDEVPQTYPLSPVFEDIMKALLIAADKATVKPELSNLRAAAYDAIGTLITSSALDVNPIILGLSQHMIGKLTQVIQLPNTDATAQLKSSILSVLNAIIKKLGSVIEPQADLLMERLLFLLNSSDGKIESYVIDVIINIGAIVHAIGEKFAKYMQFFFPHHARLLAAHEEGQLLGLSIGLAGDICRSLEENSIAYADQYIELLIKILENPQVSRTAKPEALTALGDIALSLGSHFVKYYDPVMRMMEQACKICMESKIPADDFDFIDIMNQFKENLLEGLSQILQALKNGNQGELFLKHIHIVLQFIYSITQTQDVCSENVNHFAVALLGDIADCIPKTHNSLPFLRELKAPFIMTFVDENLNLGKRSNQSELLKVAKWSKKLISTIG